MVELLVVVGIIAILLAASLPAIMRFIRNYRIRGAVEEVKAELQRARSVAISKNVNLGVVFLVTSPSTYRFVIEDRLSPGNTPLRDPGPILDAAFFDPDPANPNADRIFAERTLPQGVEFATSAAECPAAGTAPVSTAFAPNNFAVRFTRLGGTCNPLGPAGNCPEVTPGRTNVLMSFPGGTAVCLRETATALSRTLLVRPTGQFQDQG